MNIRNNTILRNTIIICGALILISLSVMCLKLEYNRAYDLMTDRDITWKRSPEILLHMVDNKNELHNSAKFALAEFVLSGRDIEVSNKDSNNDKTIINRYYEQTGTLAVEVLLDGFGPEGEGIKYKDEFVARLNEMIEIYDEVYLEIYGEVYRENTDISGRNELKFNPFKVNTKHINKLFAEKIEEKDKEK